MDMVELNLIKAKYTWHNKLKLCKCFMCKLIRHYEEVEEIGL